MAKITLADTSSGFNVAAINQNFQDIATALNDDVLWRDNPAGEANQMIDTNLDMNGNDILNVDSLTVDNLTINGYDFSEQLAQAEAALKTLNAVYLGAHATPPTVDGNGDPLTAGDLYFDTTLDSMYVWNGTAWQIMNGTVVANNYITDAMISSTSNLYNRINGWIDPKDYGCKLDGVTDDTVNFQKAEDAAAAQGKCLFIRGWALIGAAGITKRTGVSWFGIGSKLCGLKGTVGNNSLLNGGVIANVSISRVGFDFSAPTFVSFMRNIYFTTFTDSSITQCDFKQQAIGFQCDGGSRFLIADNTFTQNTAYGTTINEAIWVTANTSSPSQYIVARNIINNVGTDFTGSFVTIVHNKIYNYAYGAGITTEQNQFNATIIGNECIGGTGLDANNVPPLGIECWHNQAVIHGNTCSYNAGMGISVGGSASNVVGNICINNGVYSGGLAPTRYRCGIIIRYVDANINAGSSVVANNTCVDTGVGTQLWGITDDGSNVGGVHLYDNQLLGATAPMAVSGTRYSFRGPKLAQTITGQAGFTIAAGGYGFGNAGLTFSGAQLGDRVQASINQVMGGLVLLSWVTAANTVAYQFYNPTGASVTVANFSINIWVEKPLNYPTY